MQASDIRRGALAMQYLGIEAETQVSEGNKGILREPLLAPGSPQVGSKAEQIC